MNVSSPILDRSTYTTEMAKSLIDKVYFLDKVDAELFVDFGCADGTMIAFIEKVFPGVELVGYDADPTMVARARANNPASDAVFTDSWEEVTEIVARRRESGSRSCLVLSSVIHEAYNYLSVGELENFWRRVWGKDGIRFDAVAIRDMMVSRTTSRPSDPIAVARVRQVFDQGRLSDWEANWGSIDENWSLTHFMLTYRYEANWDREVRENYLPIPFEQFLSSVPNEYVPTFKEHFTLPFLRRSVRRDFGIDLADRTHLKLILELDR